MNNKYYLDSCIWLNLLKKEGDPKKGRPYWKIAEDFITNNSEIYISTIILKELSFKLNRKIANQLCKKHKIILIKTENKDYDLARQIERKNQFQLSFGDCLHIAICKRFQLILITRDNELIQISRKYINVFKPETLC
ncbi:PIN domain-containing protein [Candidatus Woesearchaeota archaeon]|nr:PIN domain-containing protein [Candidatus Woesearchaeota archaeon]